MRTAMLILVLLFGLGVSPAQRREAPPENVKVPNVVGMPRARALATLERVGLELDERQPQTDSGECRDKTGLVVRQKPIAGTLVAPHSKVQLAVCGPMQ